VPCRSAKRRVYSELQTPPYASEVSRPLRARVKLRSYDVVVCNSEYTRRFAERHGTAGLPLRVLYPPVDVDLYRTLVKRPAILSVGRFFVGRHEKKHGVLIEAFRRLCEGGVVGWELVLAGSLREHEADHVSYLERLREQAGALPVRFVVDASLAEMRRLYGEASLYWHAAGHGVDERRDPQFLEHFGMAIVEAMAAGAVPLVVRKGGPLEIVTDGVDGFHWTDPDELVARTAALIRGGERELGPMRAKAEVSARRFSRERFEDGIREIGRELLGRDGRP
jgi:glycosyltransferase involved in cell wall biosynthesis